MQAVVFTDLPLAQALAFDAFCHAHNPPVAFIRAETRGLFGSVFCDLGPGFTISDVDGEEPFTGILASVANSGPEALVTCVDDERLQFQDGDSVVFSEVSARASEEDFQLESLRKLPGVRARRGGVQWQGLAREHVVSSRSVFRDSVRDSQTLSEEVDWSQGRKVKEVSKACPRDTLSFLEVSTKDSHSPPCGFQGSVIGCKGTGHNWYGFCATG